MGQDQHNRRSIIAARVLRPRICLRKGCDHIYHPARWNQRYCQQPECQRLVRRWQAAKRQRAHRRLPENRKRHAEAEAKRRRQRTVLPTDSDRVADEKTASSGRAWSRGKRFPADFCDRPGCYEPLPGDSRAPVRYCGRDCRQAVRRVVDRERKWLTRNRYGTKHVRSRASQNALELRAEGSATRVQKICGGEAEPVGDYRANGQLALSCRALKRHPLPDHERGSQRDGHCKTNSDRRSRPPPT